ncbi:MAG: aminopeptidase P N-terminal domain-containing protein, partial [Planctomycetota bacterium]|nr:aminopeptidase P N-terminal domain-containing protein [Planctomycetota bacterium]
MKDLSIMPGTRTACLPLCRVALLCACLLASVSADVCGLRAQEGEPGGDSARPVLDGSFFEGRRSELMNRVREGLIVLRSAEPQGTYERYTQNNNFYYLTGIESPDAILLIIPQAREAHFFGRMPAGLAGGFKQAHKLDDFQNVMTQLVRKTREVCIPLQPEEIGCMNLDGASMARQRMKMDPWDGREGREEAFKRVLEKKFKGVKIADLSPVLFEMRRVKSDAEIRMI